MIFQFEQNPPYPFKLNVGARTKCQGSSSLVYRPASVAYLANAPVVLSQITEDGEIEVRISVG
uniref:Uncharacterized protein n=1 Tax=Timema tahoe TaxID=61484 RepID=A0A7R9IF30_9NEOP|nr:unnamed protein product [Timema tahoe]